MSIVHDTADAISKIVSGNIDRQVKAFLSKHGLPADRSKLKEYGWGLILETKDMGNFKTEYTMILYRIEDTQTFTIQSSVKIT